MVATSSRGRRIVRQKPADITPELCRTVAESSLDHLFRVLKPNGRFIYSHKAGDVTKEGPGYNLLRHCGTVWFMCLAIQGLEIRLSSERASALSAAVGYVADKLHTPPWLHGNWPCLALVSRGRIKLGGVGLAMLMMHEYQQVARQNGISTAFLGRTPDLIISQLENYALLQISSGDFIHKRDFETGRISSFHSEYYTGEALYGLMRGGRTSPVLRSVMEGLMQKNYGFDIQSHWMAYASCEAAQRRLVDPKLARSYIIGLVGNIVRDPSYRKQGNSTPIACRTEALCCFLALSRGFRPPGWPFPGDLVEQATSVAEENLRLQLQWYKDGQFWRGDDEDTVQIDYVQHNGTAFLNWYLLHRA
jgi:hypothetical protein